MKFLNLQPINEGDRFPDATVSLCEVISPCKEVMLVLRIPIPWKIAIKETWTERKVTRYGWGELVLWWATCYGPCASEIGMPSEKFGQFKWIRGM